ncbi:MAG: hypothetical protein ACLFVL_01825 [Candidatus Aenigmatarchaeota archaeon]
MVGLLLIIVGLIITTQGTSQTETMKIPDSEEDFTYEVLGPKHNLGFGIMSIGVGIQFIGGAMVWLFLKDIEYAVEIPSKLRLINFGSLLLSVPLVIVGGILALTIESQRFTTDIGVPITKFAVNQVIGFNFLRIGLISTAINGILLGMMISKGRNKPLERKTVGAKGKKEDESEDIESRGG